MTESELKEGAPNYNEHTINYNNPESSLFIKEAFFPCVCNSEGYYIMNSIEKENDERYFQEFLFIRYFLYTNKKMNFIEKLKYFYQVFKTGKRFGDEIILSANDANKLGKFLVDQTHPITISESLKSLK